MIVFFSLELISVYKERSLVGVNVVKTKLHNVRQSKKISKIWKPWNTETSLLLPPPHKETYPKPIAHVWLPVCDWPFKALECVILHLRAHKIWFRTWKMQNAKCKIRNAQCWHKRSCTYKFKKGAIIVGLLAHKYALACELGKMIRLSWQSFVNFKKIDAFFFFFAGKYTWTKLAKRKKIVLH